MLTALFLLLVLLTIQLLTEMYVDWFTSIDTYSSIDTYQASVPRETPTARPLLGLDGEATNTTTDLNDLVPTYLVGFFFITLLYNGIPVTTTMLCSVCICIVLVVVMCNLLLYAVLRRFSTTGLVPI